MVTISPKRKKIPKFTPFKRQTKRFIRQTRNYQQYYRGKKLSTSGNFGAMGETDDYLLFSIVPNNKFILLSDKLDITDLFRREMRLMHRIIVDKINKNIVGDPRVGFFGDKGKVPKGGTGRMRLATRNYLVQQNRKNVNFPFTLYFKVPVYYGKTTFRSDKRLKHSNEKASRVVGWSGGKAKSKVVNLNDPNAEYDIDKIVADCMDISSSEFKRLLSRYSSTLGFTHTRASEFFLLDPADFRDGVVRSGS